MSHTPYCTIGNISIDDLVFEDGSTMWKVPGGNSVYSALGIAVWQEKPAVIAPVGPEYPVEAVGGLIDLSHCRPLERTLRNWGLYEEGGTRIFTFRTKTRNWADFSPVAADFDNFTCDFTHIAPLRWDLQTQLARLLRQNGTRVISVDPDDRYLDELDHATMMGLLNSVDLFVPSKQDVEALLPGKTPIEALRYLRHAAPDLPMIAIKLGDSGVIMHPAGSTDYYRVPTVAEEVVDTTGAGDAFSGGALTGYAKTRSPIESILWGSVSASFAVAAMGPAGLVAAKPAEAQSRLERLRSRLDAHAL
jgi:sugar/nucleoside kinase (ribokinase family)